MKVIFFTSLLVVVCFTASLMAQEAEEATIPNHRTRRGNHSRYSGTGTESAGFTGAG